MSDLYSDDEQPARTSLSRQSSTPSKRGRASGAAAATTATAAAASGRSQAADASNALTALARSTETRVRELLERAGVTGARRAVAPAAMGEAAREFEASIHSMDVDQGTRALATLARALESGSGAIVGRWDDYLWLEDMLIRLVGPFSAYEQTSLAFGERHFWLVRAYVAFLERVLGDLHLLHRSSRSPLPVVSAPAHEFLTRDMAAAVKTLERSLNKTHPGLEYITERALEAAKAVSLVRASGLAPRMAQALDLLATGPVLSDLITFVRSHELVPKRDAWYETALLLSAMMQLAEDSVTALDSLQSYLTVLTAGDCHWRFVYAVADGYTTVALNAPASAVRLLAVQAAPGALDLLDLISLSKFLVPGRNTRVRFAVEAGVRRVLAWGAVDMAEREAALARFLAEAQDREARALAARDARIAALEAAHAALRSRAETAESAALAARDAAASLELSLAASEDSLARANLELAAAVSRVDERDALIAELRRERAAMVPAAEAAAREAALQKRLAKTQRELAGFEQLQDAALTTAQQLAAMREANKVVTREAAQADAELRQLRPVAAAAAAELSALRPAHESLTSRAAAAETGLAAATAEVERVKLALDAERAARQAVTSRAEDAAARAATELAAREAAREAAAAEAARASQRLRDLESQLASLDALHAERSRLQTSALADAAVRVDALTAALAAERDAVRTAQADYAALVARLGEVTAGAATAAAVAQSQLADAAATTAAVRAAAADQAVVLERAAAERDAARARAAAGEQAAEAAATAAAARDSELVALRSALGERAAELGAAARDRDAARARVVELEAADVVAHLRADLAAARAGAAEAERSLASTRAALESAAAARSAADAAAALTGAARDEALTRAAALASQLALAQAAVESASASADELRTRLHALETAHAALAAESTANESSARERIEQLRAEATAALAAADHARAALASAATERADAARAIGRLEGEVHAFEPQLRAAFAERDKLALQVRDADAERGALVAKYDALAIEHGRTLNRAQVAETERDSLVASTTALGTRLADTEAALAAALARQSQAEHEAALAASERAAALARAEIADASAASAGVTAAQAVASRDDALAARAAIVRERDVLAERASALSAEAQRADRELTESRIALAAMQTRLEGEMTARQRLERELAVATATLLRVEPELSDTRRALATASAELEAARGEILRLGALLAAAEKRLAELTAEVERLRADAARELSVALAARAESDSHLQGVVDSLRAELSELRARWASEQAQLSTRLADKEADSTKVERTMSKLDAQLSTARNEAAVATAECNVLAAELEATRQEVADLNEDLREAKEAIETGEKQLAASVKHFSGVLSNVNAEQLVLRQQLADVSADVDMRASEVAALTAQRDSLLEQLDAARAAAAPDNDGRSRAELEAELDALRASLAAREAELAAARAAQASELQTASAGIRQVSVLQDQLAAANEQLRLELAAAHARAERVEGGLVGSVRALLSEHERLLTTVPAMDRLNGLLAAAHAAEPEGALAVDVFEALCALVLELLLHLFSLVDTRTVELDDAKTVNVALRTRIRTLEDEIAGFRRDEPALDDDIDPEIKAMLEAQFIAMKSRLTAAHHESKVDRERRIVSGAVDAWRRVGEHAHEHGDAPSDA